MDRCTRRLVAAVIAVLSVSAAGQPATGQPHQSEPSAPRAERDPQTEPQPPAPTWWEQAVPIKLTSSPGGARLFVNGFQFVDEQGTPLRAPLELPHVLPGSYVFEAADDEGRYGSLTVEVTHAGQGCVVRTRATPSPRWLTRDPQSLPGVRVDGSVMIPSRLDADARRAALRDLFGSLVRLDSMPTTSGLQPILISFERFAAPSARLMTPIAGAWTLRGSALAGHGDTVSQLLCPLPFVPDDLHVTTKVRSDAVLELNLYDPSAKRISGGDALGRIHFGRSGPRSETDWAEVAWLHHPGDMRYGFRLAEGTQDVALELRGKLLRGTVTTQRGAVELQATTNQESLPNQVYVGIGSGVANTAEVHTLQVSGRVDLWSPEVDVLVGMGEAFWGEGRSVTIHFTAAGRCTRLFHNGEVIGAPTPVPDWLPAARALSWTTRTLHYGDVLGFELSSVTDETQLFAVGIDDETGRVVFATHPLVWRSAPGAPAADWYSTADLSADDVPRVGNAVQAEELSHLTELLHMPFPGLPITATADGEGKCALKYRVR